ncbi:hypothetical protein HH1059_01270 [Halorhodospira halochloris]|uniref:Outer membrane protein beta-barrel domain-containing protein n=1 Tax=Halorhodospira halochloris TaxID=1052 RepID=A0A0X8XBF3_HALHR|nr:YfaZ family outer membrane protein [Halorhodospira halochloris]MBK1650710.1 hypothetical protein [Halorhodospira halochloris]BAU56799.2 hypothetical protein HH1059_01270 [Halorhodospira halochloris]
MFRVTHCSGRKRFIYPVATLVALMLFASSAGAQFQQQAEGEYKFDFNLHDNAAEVVFTSPLGDRVDVAGPVTQNLGLFFNSAGDVAASAGLHASGGPTQGFNPMEVGAGAKLYGIYSEEADRLVAALAISGSMVFSITGQVPQAFIVKGNVAPNITSFGRARRLFEATMRYQFDVTPHSAVYLGYRYLRIQMGSGTSNTTMDNNLHLGMQVNF